MHLWLRGVRGWEWSLADTALTPVVERTGWEHECVAAGERQYSTWDPHFEQEWTRACVTPKLALLLGHPLFLPSDEI